PAVEALRRAAAKNEDAEIRRRASLVTKAIEDRVCVEVRRFQGHTGEVACVAFSPDGKRALSGAAKRQYSIHASREKKEETLQKEDNTVRLWDVETGKELRRFEGHRSFVVAVAFSPDGRRALSAGMVQTPPDQSATWLWDVASGKELHRFHELGGHISSVAFSPDGRQILSGGWSETVRLWDVESGRELHRFETPAMVHSVAFSPDGRRALSASGGGGR